LNIFLNVRLLLSGVGYLTCHLTCSPKRGQQKVNAIQLHWLLLTNIARNHSKSATWKPNKTHNPLRRPASRFMSYKYRHGGLSYVNAAIVPRSPKSGSTGFVLQLCCLHNHHHECLQVSHMRPPGAAC